MTKEYNFNDLTEIVEILRSDKGCPWDRAQTYESLKKCLTEECDEVLNAIDNQDMENLCEELGDVLLQVVMNAQIAKERKDFTLEDVIKGVCAKLIRRHPHVFGDAKALTPEEGLRQWEEIKRLEKLGKLEE